MRRVLLAASCVMFIGCGQTASPTSVTPVTASAPPINSDKPATPAAGVTVAGRVVDFQTHAGIEGVTIEWGFAGAWSSTRTDTTGAFSLKVKTTGLFDVKVMALTPAFRDATIYVNDAMFETIVFAGQSDCPRMYGRVFDSRTSQPIAGAIVDWIVTKAITAADGSYEVSLGCRAEGYGSGTSAVGVSHPNYLSQGFVGARKEWIQTNELHRRDFALTPR